MSSDVEIVHELEIIAMCSECGEELEVFSADTQSNDSEVVVRCVPCETCTDNARAEGREDGESDGYYRGKKEGYEEGFEAGQTVNE